MTLTELKTLLLQLLEQVNANTAAITALNNNLSNYATRDDLSTMREQVVDLLAANETLQDAVATVSDRIGKVDHLSTLLDVETNNLTFNDVLQYGNDGKWHNIQPSALGIVDETDLNKPVNLSDLDDVIISNVSNGQTLVYNNLTKKWVNGAIEPEDDDINFDDYLLTEDARKLFFPITGGLLNGPLEVKGLTTIDNNLLVKGEITFNYQ